MDNTEEKNVTIEKGNRRLKIKRARGLLIAGIVTLVLVIGIILGIHIYYAGRWYANTWIGDRDVSGMTYEESRELMENVYQNYQLEILARNDGSQTITKEQIRYQVDIQNSLQEQYDKQHETLPFFSLGTKKQIAVTLNASYDADKLYELLDQSDLHKGSDTYPVSKPKDAKVVFSKEQKYLVIQKEDLGNTLNFDNFVQAVEDSLFSGREKLDLNDEETHPDVYVKPEIYATEPELQNKVDACNPVILRWLTWKIDDNIKETVEPEQIYAWCSYADGKVTFKKKKIENWIEKLCLKYKTVGTTRTFKNHAGKKIRVAGGDYGWQLSYDSMLNQLMNVLKKEIDPALQKTYMENPGAEEQKALTFTKTPKYDNTAYRHNTEDKSADWDTKNFTEISLSDQKIYVWRKGKVVFTCKTISGRPVKDRQTRTGAYFIKEHQTHRVLKGDDYETPVDNWVRITWTGTGFHGAPWQPWSRWSKTLYKTRGSHGCLNLSTSDSKKIYDLTKYREMVFIY